MPRAWARLPCLLVAVLAVPAAAQDDEEPVYGATATVEAAPEDPVEESLGTSTVSRRQMDERQPRSAPDALRYEPGVYIQKTAHGQASAYVRGVTGQRVVHLFDGIRLNNGIYRQGPNQYFFTVDTYTVDHIDVTRGSASVRYGSDAIGGAILASPRSPVLDPEARGLTLRPRIFGRVASADREKGGRTEMEALLGRRTGILVGGGYRDVGLLRSGGVVTHLDALPDADATVRSDVLPWSPRFREEATSPGLSNRGKWRTQLGTGFREATFDARLLHDLENGLQVVGAVYGYRQFDAPRADKCPPPEAPISECLEIDEQYRTLAYVGLRGKAGPLRDIRLNVSVQRHHERRVHDRPISSVRFVSRDDVNTLGLSFQGSTRPFEVGKRGKWRLRYGFDAYRDGIESATFQSLTDVGVTVPLSRGQYLDGSTYLHAGAFVLTEVAPLPALTLRGGLRAHMVSVRAPPDPESSSPSILRELGAAVGRFGAEVRLSRVVQLMANVDQGFRAPNLDDLTSRQQTGPGFQFENPGLDPERSLSFELGVRVAHDVLELEAWSFATLLDDAIQRIVREAADCPPETPACSASRTQFQLVNLSGRAHVLGAEGGATVHLPREVSLRSTVSYAIGEGSNPGGRVDPTLADRARVPLSRVPPLHGTVELLYRHLGTGLFAAGALRWARSQQRLSVSDRSDPRIPTGGTPGHGVLDLRVGIRRGQNLTVFLITENLFDAAYRTHGSSVNGPGRGAILAVRAGL